MLSHSEKSSGRLSIFLKNHNCFAKLFSFCKSFCFPKKHKGLNWEESALEFLSSMFSSKRKMSLFFCICNRQKKEKMFWICSISFSIKELRIFYLRCLFRRCVFVIDAEDFFQSTRGTLTSVEFFLRMNNFISDLIEVVPF